MIWQRLMAAAARLAGEQPRPAPLRERASLLLTLYTGLTAVIPLAALIILMLLRKPAVDAPFFAAMVALSVITRLLGFPVGGTSNSLFGIVDVAMLLLAGPLVGACQAGLAVLIAAPLQALRAGQRTLWAAVRAPLFNAGLKATMSLVAGAVYLALGGPLRPATLDESVLVSGLALVLVWFSLDYVGWCLIELVVGGRARLTQWVLSTLPSTAVVELLPLPAAFLGAGIVVNLRLGGFILFALALILASSSLHLLAQARQRLEARVTELTTLNSASQEIIEAANDEQALCDLVYRHTSSVVDTTNFMLGLLSEDGKQESLAVLVVNGERQHTLTLPVGGVVNWMQEQRRPLIISDLATERLPFSARQLGRDNPLTRSALFVPLLAGQDLIGFMSIQSPAPASFTNDDTRILAAMASQAAMAIANIRLQRQAEARARLEREVRLASDIQRSLLPASCPIIPGFELAADWQSAREVSGDFYDFLPLPDGRTGIVIADVSDKGVPAALFMALSRSLVRSGLMGAHSPADGLRRANHWLIKDTSSDMFLTLFYATLDPVSRVLTYANAGHNPPFFISAADDGLRTLTEHGIALGVVDNIELPESTVRLEQGDVLVCYTDGVTDAINSQAERFGEKRLGELVWRQRRASPQEMIGHIKQALRDFVGAEPAFDDATIIVVRGIASPAPAPGEEQRPRRGARRRGASF